MSFVSVTSAQLKAHKVPELWNGSGWCLLGSVCIWRRSGCEQTLLCPIST